MSRCPYCHDTGMIRDEGRSYPCPDCEELEPTADERTAWSALNEEDSHHSCIALDDGRVGQIIDADPDGPDFQIQFGGETFSRMEAFHDDRFGGQAWTRILAAVDNYKTKIKTA